MNLSSAKSKQKNPSKVYQDKNLYIIIGITLIGPLGVLGIDPILPNLAQDLQIPPEMLGFVITAFVLPIAIGTPIFGVLADRFGRKQILIPSLVLFALGGMLSANAQDFRSLLEGRFLQGIGAASLESLAFTMIGDLYTGRTLMAAMAFSASAIGISAAAYPAIGGALGAFSWRYAFLPTLATLPLAWLVLTTLKLPKKQARAGRFKLKAYLKNTWLSINNARVLGLLLASLSLFIMQFGACYTFLPVLAAKYLGAESATIGVLLTTMSLSLALVAAQLKWLARIFSETTLIQISILVYASAILTFSVLDSVWLLLLPSILIGVSEGMAFPTIRTMLARLSPEEYRAGFMAVNGTAQSLGQAIGPILAGIAYGVWGIKGVFYACAGFALITLIAIGYLLTRNLEEDY